MVKTLTTRELHHNGGELRRTVKHGGQLVVTFHNKPFARVVPAEHYDELTAELERLRAQIAQQEVAA